MSPSEVRAAVIGALARARQCPPDELESELRAAGPECPCDSLWLVKAGVGAAKALGVEFKPTTEETWAFESVEALTAYLGGLLEEREAA